MARLDRKTRGFTEAYNDYYPLVFSTVYSKTGHPDDSKDIAQEVFMRLFENFTEVENIRKWLYGTLRNVIFEHFRKKKNDSDIDSILNDASMAYVNGFRESRMIIQQTLDDMNNFNDEKEKTLFDLISIHNFTYQETGAHLGMSERQVRYKYGVISNRIIQHLEKKGIKSLEELL
jgi:RNA polymerase sigma factor (sigma-70 family)